MVTRSADKLSDGVDKPHDLEGSLARHGAVRKGVLIPRPTSIARKRRNVIEQRARNPGYFS